ncbi:MAG: putative nucleotidyltransferase substrate binding domain-containing protein [Acidobacteriota bacterium]
MKTSVIRYRVADFLKENPPFDLFSLDDLLELSGTGRVIFHEDDVFVYQKGQTRDPLLWIIQQGKIQLIDETGGDEKILDLLGPGDILGLDQLRADAPHTHSARTITEAILYSFDVKAFDALIQKYPAAARYLTAHISATKHQTKALQLPANRERLLSDNEKFSWLNADALPVDLIRRRLVTCGPNTPLRVAAHLLTETQSEVLAVVGENKAPLNFITAQQLSSQVATGRVALTEPTSKLPSRGFPTAPPGLSTAGYWLEMLRQRCDWLGVTSDGTTASKLEGLITATDLAVLCGRNPVLIFQQVQAAESLEELGYLRQRLEALLVEGLAGSDKVEWFAQAVAELNALLLEKVASLVKAELARKGLSHPNIASCWLFFGRAGRREILTSSLPQLGLVFADPPPELQQEVSDYFTTLTQKVGSKLQAIGLHATDTPETASRFTDCRSLTDWKSFYAALIRQPIENAIYLAREYLDLLPVGGEQTLGNELAQLIGAELQANQGFITLLAHDTLSNLPPLTFFRGSAIDSDGKELQTLNIEKLALTPIVDAARVFALSQGAIANPNSLARLANSASSLPFYGSVLADAADGFRIANYHYALAELKQKGGAAAIATARLSKFDQRLLKTAFDIIRRFLDLTGSHFAFKG